VKEMKKLVLMVLIAICIKSISFAASGGPLDKIAPKAKEQPQQSVESLILGLKSPESDIRVDAAAKLGRSKDKRAVEPLCDALGDKSLDVRRQAAHALGALGEIDERVTKCLVKALEDRDVDAAAEDSLITIGGPAVKALTEALKDPRIKEEAVEVLGKIGLGKPPVKVKGDVIEPLCIALKDKSADVREKAVLALGQIEDPRAVEPLSIALRDPEHVVTVLAGKALGQIGKPAVEVLIAALRDPSSDVRMNAAQALGEIKDERAVEPLIAAMNDPDLSVRRHTSTAFGKIGKLAPLPENLTEDLKSQDPAKRAEVARALGDMKDARAVEPLIAALKDEDWQVRRNAAMALGEIRDARAVEPLIAALKDEVVEVRESVPFALAKIGEPALEPLIRALKDENKDIRGNAAMALLIMKNYRAVGPLIAALKDPDDYVRRRASSALSHITGKNFRDRPEEWQAWWDQVKGEYLKKRQPLQYELL
jgi:HEAT repeat protein